MIRLYGFKDHVEARVRFACCRKSAGVGAKVALAILSPWAPPSRQCDRALRHIAMVHGAESAERWRAHRHEIKNKAPAYAAEATGTSG